MTNVPWRIHLDVDVDRRRDGDGEDQGICWLGTAVGAWTTTPIPNTANTSTVSMDTTTSKVLSVGAQWSAAVRVEHGELHGFKAFSDGV